MVEWDSLDSPISLCFVVFQEKSSGGSAVDTTSGWGPHGDSARCTICSVVHEKDTVAHAGKGGEEANESEGVTEAPEHFIPCKELCKSSFWSLREAHIFHYRLRCVSASSSLSQRAWEVCIECPNRPDFSSSGIVTSLTSIFSDPEWVPWPLLPHITSLALYTTGTACLSLDSVLQQVLSWLCGVDSPWGSTAGVGGDTDNNRSLSPGMCCLLCPHCGQSSP